MDKEAQVHTSPVGSSQGSLFRHGPEPPSRLKRMGRGVSSIGRDISFWFNTTTDGIQEWTPFFMVLSYFVFSVCVYMVASSGAIEVFWFCYLMTNTYIASATVVEALMSMGPYHNAKKAVDTVARKNWTFPTPDDELLTLDLCFVAYLPNEQDIILDRMCYLLDKVVYPNHKLRIIFLYNTPYPIEPLESQMRDLALKHQQLKVIKVPNSKSKADNLNYYCSLETGADVTAIFDCDHYPHPYGPRWAIERFIGNHNIETVQGRCVVFNTDENLMTAMISVEFDKIYAVSHPGRAAMFDFGLFCGSNGYWKTSLLRELKMDGSMLTEDIDSALRAFGRGANVVHDLNVVSYELAPTTLAAFWKQRLRWSQGWAQASYRHVHLVWSRSHPDRKRTLTHRFGLLSLLYIRESSYYLITQYFCLVVSVVITNFPQSGDDVLKLFFFQYPVAYWLFILSAVCLLLTLYITFHTRSEFVRWWVIPIFTATYPVQLLVNAVMGLFGHARQVSKYVKWNPTPRG